MSRHLPARPNLEHLRKQAKALLHTMQQNNPTSRLADAQYLLAREYGFLSWPKLKLAAEAVASVDARDHSLADPSMSAAGGAGSIGSTGGKGYFGGIWVADLARSQVAPDFPFNAATLNIEVSGDKLTMIDTLFDANGSSTHTNMLLADGQEHPAPTRNGFTVTARWTSPRRLEVLVKEGGTVAGNVTYEITVDGDELIVTTEQQRVVFVRE